MKTIREAVSEIAWGGSWKYLLRSGQEVIGRLHINNDPRMSAVAESTDGSWRFKKKWFPYEKVTLHPVDSEFEIGLFKNRRIEKRASLEFPYGQKFYWMPTNFWLNRYVFTNVFGDSLIHFKRHSNPLTVLVVPKGTSRGEVEIEIPAYSLPELPLLTLLGLYLMIIDSI